MFSSRAGARPLTPALSPDAGGEGAFLPLPPAGEGRGEGYSVAITPVLNSIANQVTLNAPMTSATPASSSRTASDRPTARKTLSQAAMKA